MPRNKSRQKTHVRNLLPRAQCYGIEPGETGWLRYWEAREMVEVLKAGEYVLPDPEPESNGPTGPEEI